MTIFCKGDEQPEGESELRALAADLANVKGFHKCLKGDGKFPACVTFGLIHNRSEYPSVRKCSQADVFRLWKLRLLQSDTNSCSLAQASKFRTKKPDCGCFRRSQICVSVGTVYVLSGVPKLDMAYLRNAVNHARTVPQEMGIQYLIPSISNAEVVREFDTDCPEPS